MFYSKFCPTSCSSLSEEQLSLVNANVQCHKETCMHAELKLEFLLCLCLLQASLPKICPILCRLAENLPYLVQACWGICLVQACWGICLVQACWKSALSCAGLLRNLPCAGLQHAWISLVKLSVFSHKVANCFYKHATVQQQDCRNTGYMQHGYSKGKRTTPFHLNIIYIHKKWAMVSGLSKQVYM